MRLAPRAEWSDFVRHGRRFVALCAASRRTPNDSLRDKLDFVRMWLGFVRRESNRSVTSTTSSAIELARSLAKSFSSGIEPTPTRTKRTSNASGATYVCGVFRARVLSPVNVPVPVPVPEVASEEALTTR
jgi:hypothetical protein